MVSLPKSKLPLKNKSIKAPAIARVKPLIFKRVIRSFKINKVKIKTMIGLDTMMIAELMGCVKLKPHIKKT